MRNVLRTVLQGSLCLLLTAPCYAATIDFTNSAAWSLANGQTTYTSTTLYDGIQVTLTANTGTLTFNGGGDIHPQCSTTTGLSCQGDGIGINAVGDTDEVDIGTINGGPHEQLTVTFSSPVRFVSFGFLDFYATCAPNNQGCDDLNSPEQALWFYGVGPGQDGSLLATGTYNAADPGYGTASSLGSGYFTSVTFYAGSPANTNFALAKITIPEPGSLLLFGAGLVGTGIAVRRRARKH